MAVHKKTHRIRWIVLIVAAALLLYFVGVLLYSLAENQTIHVSSYTVTNEKIPEAFNGSRIVLLTDLHNEDWGAQLTDTVREQSPDIIMIAGDWIDKRSTDITAAKTAIEQLVTIAPVYYVAGNHEAHSSHFGELVQTLLGNGVNVLENRSVSWAKGSDSINLIGVYDPEFSTHLYRDLPPLVQEDQYNILLYHRPEELTDCAQYGVDLVLAGHAHGGQICLPFIGALLAPNQGFFPKYSKGLYSENGTDMVLSAGLGYSGIRLRTMDPPDLVTVTLQSQK